MKAAKVSAALLMNSRGLRLDAAFYLPSDRDAKAVSFNEQRVREAVGRLRASRRKKAEVEARAAAMEAVGQIVPLGSKR